MCAEELPLSQSGHSAAWWQSRQWEGPTFLGKEDDLISPMKRTCHPEEDSQTAHKHKTTFDTFSTEWVSTTRKLLPFLVLTT
jgi:hypothetical protein